MILSISLSHSGSSWSSIASSTYLSGMLLHSWHSQPINDCISGSSESIINLKFGSFNQPYCSGGRRLSYGSGECEWFHKFVTQHVQSQCLPNDVYVDIRFSSDFLPLATTILILCIQNFCLFIGDKYGDVAL